MYRAGLRAALESDSTFAVVGEAASAMQVASAVDAAQPDILLLREAEGASSQLDVVRVLAAAADHLRTVIIGAPLDIAEMSEAVRLGVVGFIAPTMDARLLRQCLRAIVAGELWMPRDSIASLVRTLGHRPVTSGASRPFGLTQRELDVVMAVAEGYTNRDIAERFSIKEDTVKHHVSAAFDKTGTFSRVELALFALHHHLGRVTLGPDRGG